MSCHPRLLIADEPTTALDATIQAQYIALFKDIQAKDKRGHNLHYPRFRRGGKICDRVGVMYAGKIVETAPTRA